MHCCRLVQPAGQEARLRKLQHDVSSYTMCQYHVSCMINHDMMYHVEWYSIMHHASHTMILCDVSRMTFYVCSSSRHCTCMHASWQPSKPEDLVLTRSWNWLHKRMMSLNAWTNVSQTLRSRLTRHLEQVKDGPEVIHENVLQSFDVLPKEIQTFAQSSNTEVAAQERWKK